MWPPPKPRRAPSEGPEQSNNEPQTNIHFVLSNLLDLLIREQDEHLVQLCDGRDTFCFQIVILFILGWFFANCELPSSWLSPLMTADFEDVVIVLHIFIVVINMNFGVVEEAKHSQGKPLVPDTGARQAQGSLGAQDPSAQVV